MSRILRQLQAWRCPCRKTVMRLTVDTTFANWEFIDDRAGALGGQWSYRIETRPTIHDWATGVSASVLVRRKGAR